MIPLLVSCEQKQLRGLVILFNNAQFRLLKPHNLKQLGLVQGFIHNRAVRSGTPPAFQTLHADVSLNHGSWLLLNSKVLLVEMT